MFSMGFMYVKIESEVRRSRHCCTQGSTTFGCAALLRQNSLEPAVILLPIHVTPLLIKPGLDAATWLTIDQSPT